MEVGKRGAGQNKKLRRGRGIPSRFGSGGVGVIHVTRGPSNRPLGQGKIKEEGRKLTELKRKGH